MARKGSILQSILSSPLKLSGIICGLVLIISIFLPWITPSSKLGGQFSSASAGNLSSYLAITGVMLGLLVIIMVLIPSQKTRSYLHVIFGVVVIAVLVLMICNHTLPLLSSMVRSYIHIGIGTFLFAIAGLATLCIGLIERPKPAPKIMTRPEPVLTTQKTRADQEQISASKSSAVPSTKTAPVDQQSVKKPKVSFAWWILPVLLGILGGIIAFAVVYKRRPGRALAMLILGLCQSIFVFAIIWNIIQTLSNLGL